MRSADGAVAQPMINGTRGVHESRRAPLFALWVAAFSFYAVTGAGHTSSWDGALMFLSARNFLDHRDLSVPPYPGTELLRRTGVGGRQYVKFAPGLVFAHLPMLAVARIARHLPIVSLPTGEHPRPRYEDEFWVQLTNAWITSTVLLLLACFAIELGGSWRDACLLVLLVGLAGPLWLYAKADGTEALQALALVGACHFFRRARARNGSLRDHWIAGAFTGLGLLAKTFNAVLAPIFVVLLLASPRGRRLGALAAFVLPILAALALTALYNDMRFGSPLDTGYDLIAETFDAPILPGVLKLLLSPSYGLLWFWPASVLALMGIRDQWRTHTIDTLLVSGVFLCLLLAYARWWAYSGFGWGPRFLIPVVPVLAVLALPVVSSRRGSARALVLVCLLTGTVVQTLASTTNHWQQILFGVYRYAECGTDGRDCVDDPRMAPLRVAWWRLRGAILRERNPERFAVYVESPPWAAARPWRWPDLMVERQRENTGVDYWAAPEGWKLERVYLWAPGLEAPIPSSRRLATALAISLCGSLFFVLRAVRSEPDSA